MDKPPNESGKIAAGGYAVSPGLDVCRIDPRLDATSFPANSLKSLGEGFLNGQGLESPPIVRFRVELQGFRVGV